MSADYQTIEHLARQLATSRGCDYDRKGAKRAYWRGKASRMLALKPESVMRRLLRACGWSA